VRIITKFSIHLRTIAARIALFPPILAAFLWVCAPLAQGKQTDTCSISLVQQAKIKRMGRKEVICDEYQVKDGDYLWKILRRKGLLKRPDFPELFSALKRLNTSLANLDIIHPGQTIVIPLNIIPISKKEVKGFQKSIMGISSLKDVNYENYVVKPGDNLSMIVYGKYKIPQQYLYDEYLTLIRKFNPTIKNLNTIYPNQVIRLPIFSPEIVRMPIEATKEKPAFQQTEIPTSEASEQTILVRKKLQYIFTQMGEQWVDIGDHFIPLKAGGQIHLKADSFPVLHLADGMRLIIDLKNELPQDISQLILADWKSYRIVHLHADDGLKTAMDKILAISNYHKILKPGEQFKIRTGNIDIALAGDWVIIPRKGENDIPEKVAVINLIHSHAQQTPVMIKAYLEHVGINIIEYTDHLSPKDAEPYVPPEKQLRITKNKGSSLPTLLLSLAGQPFSGNEKISVYQGKGSKFNVIIQADLFFHRNGKDYIITKTDLSPAILSLLTKHQFQVLSLANEKNLIRMTQLILDFMGLSYDTNPHRFQAAVRDKSRNIMLTVPGIGFYDREGNHILATSKKMPTEIISFLNQKGYTLLALSQFESE
jgi:LysM repeat protein